MGQTASFEETLRRLAVIEEGFVEDKAGLGLGQVGTSTLEPKTVSLIQWGFRAPTPSAGIVRGGRNATGPDTPASTAPSSVFTPRAIAAQNLTRSSRHATVGRPGDGICARYSRAAFCLGPPDNAPPPDRGVATTS